METVPKLTALFKWVIDEEPTKRLHSLKGISIILSSKTMKATALTDRGNAWMLMGYR